MIDFPNSPTLNQTFSAAGKTWRWNGSAWQTVGGSGGGVTSYNDLTDLPTLGTAAATASTDYATALHKASHATGGTDALTPADLGASATGHTHPLSQLEQSSATNGQVPTWNSATLAWVPQTPTGLASNVVVSNTTGITGADQVTNIVSLTQAEYDAIVTPNASTLYIITD